MERLIMNFEILKNKMEQIYDVIIIGAGVIGCSIARELSRYDIRTLVLEKECDVAYGTSGRMSAVSHAGFNNKPGTLMAKFCVEGNRGMKAICDELSVPYKKTGKVLVAFDEDDMNTLKGLVARGEENGCEGLRLIDTDEIKRIVPGIGGIGGMLSPNTAIYDPFEYCIAHAENAADNGVDFAFNSEVTGIEKIPAEKNDFGGGIHGTAVIPRFTVHTAEKKYQCRYIVNSAGLYCDKISAMLGVNKYTLYPCKGEYYILDRLAGNLLDIPVYPAPKSGIGGLGVHLTPTIDGNIIIGPSAEYLDERDDYGTTSEIMSKLLAEAKALFPAIEQKHIIGNYCGIRPKQVSAEEGGFKDFVIKEEEGCPGLINLIGIESPGFTASAPIARKVRDILGQDMDLSEKKDFNPIRKGRIRFRELSKEEQEKLIAEDPEYGEIICRCQTVTKREIRDAIENMLGTMSLSSIKYRAWCMTGRCNGGYCMNKIVDILVNDYHVPVSQITYRGKGSEMFTGEVK